MFYKVLFCCTLIKSLCHHPTMSELFYVTVLEKVCFPCSYFKTLFIHSRKLQSKTFSRFLSFLNVMTIRPKLPTPSLPSYPSTSLPPPQQNKCLPSHFPLNPGFNPDDPSHIHSAYSIPPLDKGIELVLRREI